MGGLFNPQNNEQERPVNWFICGTNVLANNGLGKDLNFNLHQ